VKHQLQVAAQPVLPADRFARFAAARARAIRQSLSLDKNHLDRQAMKKQLRN